MTINVEFDVIEVSWDGIQQLAMDTWFHAEQYKWGLRQKENNLAEDNGKDNQEDTPKAQRWNDTTIRILDILHDVLSLTER